MTAPEWAEALRRGVFQGSAVDLKDGYIHLSTAGQLRDTINKHFAGQDDLVLVAIPEGSITPDLKWEASRGGALFPHLYASLPVKLAAAVSSLALFHGAHVLPDGIP
jgi:uncharacterized protein (DUF952 family)